MKVAPRAQGDCDEFAVYILQDQYIDMQNSKHSHT